MDTTDSSEENSGPAGRRRGSVRPGLLGAVLGIGAVLGALTLLTGGAGAQPAVIVDGDHDPDAEWAELDEALADYEACLFDHGLIEEFEEDGEFDEFHEDGEYDQDGGFDEDGEFDVEAMESFAFVLVEDEDGSTVIEFGDGDGEISLTKVDGEIAIATEGDVATETLDWDDLEAEYDEAFEVCDELLEDIEDIEDIEGFEDDEKQEDSEGVED